MAKYANNISRAWTKVKTQLQRLKEDDSTLSESEDKDEASHFQMTNNDFGKSDFQFSQLDKE